MIESPCIRNCTLDFTGEICLGCRRTVKEIMAWASLSDTQRARIMAELPQRRPPGATNPPKDR